MVSKFRYGQMTWPEIGQAAKDDRVAVVPVATIEDHGPHLPVDADLVICEEICKRASERIAGDVVLVPTVVHGYSPHHMDFPGSITIGGETFMQYVLDVCKSLAHHGFRRIILVNSHGSNAPFLEAAARLTIIETAGKVLCASVSYWLLAGPKAAADKVITSGEATPGHAGEFETSIYLAIYPELVDMSKAVREFPRPALGAASVPGSVVAMMPFWSTSTNSGLMGDATVATKEKGEVLLEAAVADLAALVKEFRGREIGERVDHH